MSKFSFKFLLLVLLVSSTTHVQSNEFDTGIEVSGNGSITTIPDNFNLSLTITERGRVTSKLKVLVDKKSNLVMQAAKNLGISKQDINSAQVNLRVIEEKPSITLPSLSLDNKNKSTLFELSRRIQANFNNIDDYDQFLTQLVKIDVNHISSLAMSVTQRDKYYQQALLLAISQAKNKAQKMIQHSGERLGKLIYLKEQSTNYYQPRYTRAMMSDASSESHTSSVGSQTIKASVLMKFAIAK